MSPRPLAHLKLKLVGALLERSPAAIISFFGVFRAGAVYVPLDPSYPAARLAQMIEDANIDTVIINAENEVPELNVSLLKSHLPTSSCKQIKLSKWRDIRCSYEGACVSLLESYIRG
jgi:non-ribosomal peptide synthetase component F